MRSLITLVVVLVPFLAFSQNLKNYNLMTNRVIVNHPESTIYAFVAEKNTRSVKENYFYYWFASNDIKKTRGAYEGRLMHGVYTEFYLNKNLKEKGRIHYGLKEGVWKSWYPNGEYREIIQYHRSRQMKFKEFYDNGKLLSTGRYKNEKLHGIVKVYEEDGTLQKIRYKDGLIVEDRNRAKNDTLKSGKKRSSRKREMTADTTQHKAKTDSLIIPSVKNPEKNLKESAPKDSTSKPKARKVKKNKKVSADSLSGNSSGRNMPQRSGNDIGNPGLNENNGVGLPQQNNNNNNVANPPVPEKSKSMSDSTQVREKRKFRMPKIRAKKDTSDKK